MSSAVIQSFGGGEAVNLAQLQGINAAANPGYNVTVALEFGPVPPLLTQGTQSGEQRQWNLVDTLSLSIGTHQLKFGIDYRRLSPIQRPYSPYPAYYYYSDASVQANSVDVGVGQSQAVAYPVYINFSTFAQDDWRLTPRLNLSMGLRWEVNPAPGASNGNLPYTVQGTNDLSTMTLAPQGTRLWKTSWYNFAPRLGAAYVLQNSQRFETVLRGGGGVFFDTGQQSGSAGYMGPGLYALSVFGTFLGSPASFPVPLSQAGPAIVNPPVPPYSGNVYAFPSHFQLPFTLQWNTSVEQALGRSQALTLVYVGSHGARLLQQNQVNVCIPPSPCLNPNFGEVLFEKNGLTSDYDALQVQFQRRLSGGLQALASYTWSHSIDYGSYNYALPYLRGNSDFDLRHSFSSALTYNLPNSGFENRFARATLSHWSLDTRFSARTGFPVTLNGNEIVDPETGVAYLGNLNLVPGQPIYIDGPQCTAVYNNGKPCPGGRAINPNAFALPASGTGDAPRNFARGFGAWQMDFAVRREFPVHERLKLQFRAETFNIFNHPSFGQIDALFGDPTFGQALATLNSSLPGLSSLYQSGGPRSMQFALKLMF